MLAAQPTFHGREVHRLTLFGGKLYPAGGDYNANTGPLTIEALDVANPGAGLVGQGFVAQTEQLWRGRTIGGDLVLTYVDPRAAGSGSYARLHAGAWTAGGLPADPVHAFDVAETIEGLWLSGSGDVAGFAQGRVWRSADNGATWTPEAAVDAAAMMRCYGIIAAGDDLVMFGFGNGSWVVWYRPAGGAWAQVDNAECGSGLAMSRGGRPLVFALQRGLPEGLSEVGRVRVYGAPAAASAVAQAVADLGGLQARDLTVSADGGTLYLLTGPQIWALGPSGPATKVLTLADNAAATAIACDANRFYLGNGASTVYAVPIP